MKNPADLGWHGGDCEGGTGPSDKCQLPCKGKDGTWIQPAPSLLGWSCLVFQSRQGWDSIPDREEDVFQTCYLLCGLKINI